MALTDQALDEALERVIANIGKPKRVQTDAGEVEQFTAGEMLAAITEGRAQLAASSGRVVGPRFARFKMGGTVPGC